MSQGQINLDALDPAHQRIYKNLIGIQSPGTRVQMIHTLLSGPEYITAFKRCGLYSHLLSYLSAIQRGERAPLLPGERSGFVVREENPKNTSSKVSNQIVLRGGGATLNGTGQGQLYKGNSATVDPFKQVVKNNANKKAMSYFSSCLIVLNLQEEVALTEEALKAAYKKAATRAHPDKGGSEEAFEAVTRSYAYLSEILSRVRGGREKEGVVEAPEKLTTGRTDEAKSWEHVEPVRLNAKNLNMDAFNKMFEETRMPDPDDEGYGDWLRDGNTGAASVPGGKDKSTASGPNFGGKFNRDVFHKMFEDEVKNSQRGTTNNHQLAVMTAQSMTLAPTMGVEIGRDRPADFTAPYSAQLAYTDLRNAYTRDSTFSAEVANVPIENRSFSQYQANYKAAPAPLQDHEMEAYAASEKRVMQNEEKRKVRAAQDDIQANDFFERMKRLVITEK